MKTLLVPVARHTLLDSVLDTAILTARRFGAGIEGFGLRPALAEYVPVDMVGGMTWCATRKPTSSRHAIAAGCSRPRWSGPPLPARAPISERTARAGAGGPTRLPRRLPGAACAAVLRHRGRPARQRGGGAAHDDPGGGPVRERPPPDHRPTDLARQHRRETVVIAGTVRPRPPPRGRLRGAFLAAPRIEGAGGRCGMVPGPSAEEMAAASTARACRRKAARSRWPPHRRRDFLDRGRGDRLRPSGQGRLYPEPPAPDDLRRRHQPHPRPCRHAGADGALTGLMSDFTLDPRLDRYDPARRPALSRVLLLERQALPWLVLVPRLPGVSELTDLSRRFPPADGGDSSGGRGDAGARQARQGQCRRAR